MSPAPLHILCFGDSLTEGYNSYGMSYDPYSTALQKKLKEALGEGKGEGYQVNIVTEGVSGQLVTQGFLGRMGRIYSADPPPSYDWLIFLGGTNDLGWGKPIPAIHSTIQECISIPLSHGARVLLLTVPECGVNSVPLNRKRDALNDMLKEEKEGVFILDLKEKIPYHTMEERERERIWDDGLHFTKEGYERVGELIAERLVGIMRGEGK